MRDHQSPRARPHWNRCLGTYLPAPVAAVTLGEGRWRHLLPSRRPTTPSEFLVVNLIPEHDVEPHEQFPGNGDDGFGAAAAPEYGAVVAFEVDFRVRGDQAGLAQDKPEQGTALFGDLAEAAGVGGGVDGRGQAGIADDVLAIREAGDRAEDHDGRQGRQRADAGVGKQEPGPWI